MRPINRRLLGGTTVAVAAALFIAVRPWSPGSAPSPEPAAASPSASAAQAGANIIPPADPDPWAVVDWAELPKPIWPAEPALIRIDGAVDAGDAIVAWGRASAPGRNDFNDLGAIFVTRDGHAWRTVLIEHGVNRASTSEIRGVAAGPSGYLAYGSVCCEPEGAAVWHSADAEQWTRLDIGGELDVSSGHFVGVVGIGQSWVAAVGDAQGAGAAMYSSQDGSAWTSTMRVGDGLPGLTIADIAVGTDGVIAVGTVTGDDGSYDGAVWRSPDGSRWERLGAADPALTGDGETRLQSVVPHAGGLFISGFHGAPAEGRQCEQVGKVASADPTLMTGLSCAIGSEHSWISPDGETWERVDPAGGADEHPIEFRVVVPGGPGLVLLGESSPPASPDTTLFVSADGERWTAVAPPMPLGGAVATGLVVRDRSLLAITNGSSGPDSAGVWTGEAR